MNRELEARRPAREIALAVRAEEARRRLAEPPANRHKIPKGKTRGSLLQAVRRALRGPFSRGTR